MKRTALALLTLLATSLMLAACGDSTPAPSLVTVGLNEWTVSPDATTVAAGSVTFTATNSGRTEHELVIMRTDRAPDKLVSDSATVDEVASGTVVGEIQEGLAPGSSRTASFDLTPGKYVLFCNLLGHYDAGMRVALTVR